MLVGLLSVKPVFGVLFMESRTESGARTLIISAETPERVQGFSESTTKRTLERFHLDTYQADHGLQYGTPAFDHVSAGDDPPDFLLEQSGRRVYLDCAAFADEHHRNSFRLMQHLRKRLVEGADGRNFDGVKGCLISVWFGATLDALPPKRSDDAVIEPLLDAIAACTVDRAALRELGTYVAERGFPSTLPPSVHFAVLPDQSAGFIANAILDPSQADRLPTGLGFDVQLSRSFTYTESDALSWLQRIVDKHDKPEISHLLISAGAPDVTGYRYPSEEAVACFLVQNQTLAVVADHLQAVTMHCWSSRLVVRIDVRPRT